MIAPEDSTNALPTDVMWDSAAKASVDSTPIISDSINYKMIFEITTSKSRANTRIANLNKGSINAKMDSVTTNGMLRFRMFLEMKLSSNDTIRAKDSLQTLFMRPITIEQ
jgi:hypothetical protein